MWLWLCPAATEAVVGGRGYGRPLRGAAQRLRLCCAVVSEAAAATAAATVAAAGGRTVGVAAGCGSGYGCGYGCDGDFGWGTTDGLSPGREDLHVR